MRKVISIPSGITLTLLCFFCFTASQSVCQTHGYLGKPISFHYEFGFIPNFFEPNAKNNSWGTSNLLSAVKTHTAVIEYQISRKSQLGFAAGYTKTGVDPAGFSIEDNPPGSRNSVSYQAPFQEVDIFTFELRYTTFDGGLAPVGNFTTFKIGMNRSGFENDMLQLQRGANPDPTLPPRLRYMSPVTQYYGGIVLGKQRVIFDRFSFRYGIEFNINVHTFNSRPIVDFFEFDHPSDQEVRSDIFLEEMDKVIKSRIAAHMGILFKMGIGILGP